MQSAEPTMSFASLPPPTSFYGALEFHTSPGLTQEQYEAKIKNGWKPTDPDYLKIEVHKGGVRHIITTQRVILSGAPIFAAFFNSSHYLPGASFTIRLPHQSVACLQTALTYLTRMELYDVAELKTTLRQYQHHDQVLFLVRLALLAANLQVVRLEGLAHRLLEDIEHHVTADDCVAVARVVYGAAAVPNPWLRSFVLAAVGQHVSELRGDRGWEVVVRQAGAALERDFGDVVANCVVWGPS